MIPSSVGVIGLGAIGGSVAWRAARSGVTRVVGYAASARDRAEAARAGAITEVAHGAEQVARDVELVVLAVPPAASLELLRRLASTLRDRPVLCTDVSSVKAPIVELARTLHLDSVFAGSHPFAGTQASGFEAAREDLLTSQVVYVTPVGPDPRPAAEVTDFWDRVIGMRPVAISAEQHDRQLAWTSHLPQVVASALAGALAGLGPEGATYGPGARSTTRLASSSVEMWTDIFRMNRTAILETMAGFSGVFEGLRVALSREDEDAVATWLSRAAEWRRMLDRES
jgi:prephenate dehydrogenase